MPAFLFSDKLNNLLMIPDFNSATILAGITTYIALCIHPVRGDVWLAGEIIAALAVLTYRKYFCMDPLGSAMSCSFWAVIYQCCSLAMSAVVYRVSPFHPLAQFPGPLINRITSLKMVQMTASGRRFEQLAKLHQKYGTFVRTGPNAISVNTHAAVAPIYGSANAWNKSGHYSLGSLPGRGLFFILNRDVHNVRRRHFWAPAFSAESISSYYPMLERHTDVLLDVMAAQSQKGKSADLSLLMQYWAHDVTGELTFGDAHDTSLLREGDKLEITRAAVLETQSFEILGEATSVFEILWYLPLTKIFRVMDDVARHSLQLRREKGSQQLDIMEHLLNDQPPANVKNLSEEDLRQEATLALQAGTNGISTSITFAVYFLASHPAVYTRLKKELQHEFPEFEGGLDHQKLINLPYLSAVVEESFRLGGPVGALSRIAPKGGAFVAGKYIPEGTTTSVPAWAQMISEENFSPHPLEYKPERWLPGGLGPNTRTNRGALMTFSHGPFGCLGKAIAYHEMRVVLAKLLLQHDFKLAPEFSSEDFLGGIKNMRAVTFAHPLKIVLV